MTDIQRAMLGDRDAQERGETSAQCWTRCQVSKGVLSWRKSSGCIMGGIDMDYNALIEHLKECGTYGFKQEECAAAATVITDLLTRCPILGAEELEGLK